jgi:hypothetical protein
LYGIADNIWMEVYNVKKIFILVRPINTLESVFIMIRAEMSSGGARLDLSNFSDYTEREAQEAFYRVAQHHGWQ